MKIMIYILVFIVSMALIINGQRNIGAQGLLIQLCGLIGLIAEVYFYNKKFV